MPNAKVLSEKQAIVAALTEKLQNSAAGVIVDYKGGAISPAAVRCAACVSCMTPVSAAVSAPMFTSFHWRSRQT